MRNGPDLHKTPNTFSKMMIGDAKCGYKVALALPQLRSLVHVYPHHPTQHAQRVY